MSVEDILGKYPLLSSWIVCGVFKSNLQVRHEMPPEDLTEFWEEDGDLPTDFRGRHIRLVYNEGREVRAPGDNESIRAVMSRRGRPSVILVRNVARDRKGETDQTILYAV